jgi:HEPN domain-containing protein
MREEVRNWLKQAKEDLEKAKRMFVKDVQGTKKSI